jgi:hypothetical protein
MSPAIQFVIVVKLPNDIMEINLNEGAGLPYLFSPPP